MMRPEISQQPEGQVFAVTTDDGATLVYAVYGSGPKTLVFLHGNHEDRHVFDGRWEGLEQDYRLVMVDTRWHGLSGNGTISPLTYELFAQDLELIFAHAHISKATLIGFSDGAITSILFALSNLEKVEGLVLIGSNIFPEAIAPEDMAGMKKSYEKASRWARFFKKQRREQALLGLMMFEPHIDSARLGAITVPARVVVGENDLILPDHTKLIADSLPQSQLVIIPDSTHNVMKHNPEAFDEMLSSFLQELYPEV